MPFCRNAHAHPGVPPRLDELPRGGAALSWPRLGRALVEHVERALQERGCPKVNLQVRPSNPEAVAFYRRLGYAQDESISLGKRLIED